MKTANGAFVCLNKGCSNRFVVVSRYKLSVLAIKLAERLGSGGKLQAISNATSSASSKPLTASGMDRQYQEIRTGT
ncbi:hypothetical protein INT46_011197 [Mucor plumbeus]|uniref:Uncharacterized protein n=1 Tax=Mucor plumbeus TaxID=97098 RepID=A0A8H7RBS6_9FUNG|nr:hypothetical protein INT46_011197 [Mucor plumbeus]